MSEDRDDNGGDGGGGGGGDCEVVGLQKSKSNLKFAKLWAPGCYLEVLVD